MSHRPAGPTFCVLWRESRWHCGIGYRGSRWAATLYVDNISVSECAIDTFAGMLRIAQRWHDAVKVDEGGAQTGILVLGKTDRRANRRDRRVVTRNGRRATDPLTPAEGATAHEEGFVLDSRNQKPSSRTSPVVDRD